MSRGAISTLRWPIPIISLVANIGHLLLYYGRKKCKPICPNPNYHRKCKRLALDVAQRGKNLFIMYSLYSLSSCGGHDSQLVEGWNDGHPALFYLTRKRFSAMKLSTRSLIKYIIYSRLRGPTQKFFYIKWIEVWNETVTSSRLVLNRGRFYVY